MTAGPGRKALTEPTLTIDPAPAASIPVRSGVHELHRDHQVELERAQPLFVGHLEEAAQVGGHGANDVARAAGLIAAAVLPVAAGITGDDYLDPAAVQGGLQAAALIAATFCAAG